MAIKHAVVCDTLSFMGYDVLDEPDLVLGAIKAAGYDGACLLVRRKVFWGVGGFDELEFPNTLQDFDFCLKLIQQGYRIVYTPHSQLYQHETASRSQTQRLATPRQVNFFNRRWQSYIDDDPYYSPNLPRDREDYSLSVRSEPCGGEAP